MRVSDPVRIGVATSERPYGPFRAEPSPMAGSYSIDPCCLHDTDGRFYLGWGGIWGGQLQNYRDNRYAEHHAEQAADRPQLRWMHGDVDQRRVDVLRDRPTVDLGHDLHPAGRMGRQGDQAPHAQALEPDPGACARTWPQPATSPKRSTTSC